MIFRNKEVVIQYPSWIVRKLALPGDSKLTLRVCTRTVIAIYLNVCVAEWQ
mgnify:CR=1 FL=1